MKEFPLLFACPHYLYDLNKRKNKTFMNLFLLLKFEWYDEWLLRGLEDREKLYRFIKNSENQVFYLR